MLTITNLFGEEEAIKTKTHNPIKELNRGITKILKDDGIVYFNQLLKKVQDGDVSGIPKGISKEQWIFEHLEVRIKHENNSYKKSVKKRRIPRGG